jgi:cytochrome c oxidase cbb3-type subunit I/II
MIGTILKNVIYMLQWFYLATFVTVAVLHIFNSLSTGIANEKLLVCGVQDAFNGGTVITP